MKILFFIESLYSGGKERRLVELLKGLKNYSNINYELVLTRRDIHYKDVLALNIKIHYLDRKFIRKDPRLFFLFYKICKNFRPDIIHVWGNMAAFYSFPAKLLLRLKLLNNQITNAPDKIRKGILSPKIAFLFSDKIIANSKAGLESYAVSSKKSMVIYNGFDFFRLEKLTSKELIRKQFSILTKKAFAMVASFQPNKDYVTYINAANLILKDYDDVTFLCVGNGDNTAFRQLVLPENIDKIKFLGQ